MDVGRWEDFVQHVLYRAVWEIGLICFRYMGLKVFLIYSWWLTATSLLILYVNRRIEWSVPWPNGSRGVVSANIRRPRLPNVWLQRLWRLCWVWFWICHGVSRMCCRVKLNIFFRNKYKQFQCADDILILFACYIFDIMRSSFTGLFSLF